MSDLIRRQTDVIDTNVGDIIRRQDAIDALEKHEKSKGHNNYAFVDIVSECAEIIRDVPSAQPEQQWIPCSERLPEPVTPSQRRGWFITSNQYDSVTITCYEFESSPFKEGWQTDMTILAWMPLPEPWKGEQE